MLRLVCTALWLIGSSAAAGVIAAQDIPAGTLISQSDLGFDSELAGLDDPSLAVGRQARVAIYAGRAVAASSLRDPVLVSRNQIVRVFYDVGTLRIEAEGRALGEGSAGDIIRIMNMSSRSTISATIEGDGTLSVSNSSRELK